jgi:hypothetical protein
LLDHPCHLSLVRDVAGYAGGVVTGQAYPLGAPADQLLVAVSYNHRGACFGERRGRGKTYAATGSCD